MSIIKNTGIKRGEKLTFTDLNAEFTAVNTAFPMDDDNVRNEGIDYRCIKTNTSGTASGKNGLILVNGQSLNLQSSGSSTVIREYPAGSSQALGIPATPTSPIDAKENDILRVYWQIQATTTIDNNVAIGTGTNPYSSACWAIRLQWEINGAGSFTEVPGQSDMNQTIGIGQLGTIMSETNATTLVNAGIVHKDSTGSTTFINVGPRTVYGSYYYKFTTDTIINKMRLIGQGLFLPLYQSSGGGIPAYAENKNCLLLNNTTPTQQIDTNQIDLTYLLLRSE
jgi:hypothetical protein